MSNEIIDMELMEKLFDKYRNQYVNVRMTEQQNENLKHWHEKREKYGITLSQIDHWMLDTQIVPKIVTIFETGTIFSRLKIFAVDFVQFLSFIDQVSLEKNLNPEEIKLKMLEAKYTS